MSRAVAVPGTVGIGGQGLGTIGGHAGHDPAEDVVLVVTGQAIGTGLAEQVAGVQVIVACQGVAQGVGLGDREQPQGTVIGGGGDDFGNPFGGGGAVIRPHPGQGDVTPGVAHIAGHHLEVRLVGFADFLGHRPGVAVVHRLGHLGEGGAALGVSDGGGIELVGSPAHQIRRVVGVLVERGHALDHPSARRACWVISTRVALP